MINWLVVKLHKTIGLSEDFRSKFVESVKQNFLESLREVEFAPMSESVVEKSRELGFEYERIAEDLEIDIKSSRDGFDRSKDISVAQYKGLHKDKDSTSETNDELDTDEIMVVVSGNWADTTMILTEWIEKGPGMRFLRHPYRAWNLKTGEELSLDKISIQYRNNEESRKKIADNEIPDPWDFETTY